MKFFMKRENKNKIDSAEKKDRTAEKLFIQNFAFSIVCVLICMMALSAST